MRQMFSKKQVEEIAREIANEEISKAQEPKVIDLPLAENWADLEEGYLEEILSIKPSDILQFSDYDETIFAILVYYVGDTIIIQGGDYNTTSFSLSVENNQYRLAIIEN